MAASRPAIRDLVLQRLETGKRWRLPQLRASVESELGRSVLDGTISAKLRDLRKPKYGGHRIPKGRAIGADGKPLPNTYEYWLEREPVQGELW